MIENKSVLKQMEGKMNKLQMVYAASLIDSLRMYDQFGITDDVIEKKYKEQLIMGKHKLSQLQIENKAEVFTKLKDLFGCANWEISKSKNKLTASATNCMLCSFAKKANVSAPCNLFCLDPMEGLIKGLDPSSTYQVNSTLWNDNKCIVEVE